MVALGDIALGALGDSLFVSDLFSLTSMNLACETYVCQVRVVKIPVYNMFCGTL